MELDFWRKILLPQMHNDHRELLHASKAREGFPYESGGRGGGEAGMLLGNFELNS